jgi:Asp-tRNA(Asn)/Glu-tRNA(Gln) amidotransferase A subunit family amidase
VSTPWLDDACSLVDAFRAGELTPLEAVDASLDAIEASNLNAFSFVDGEGARAKAKAADTSLPLGGVPVAIKELDSVEGWPATEASLAFKDRVSTYTQTSVQRLINAGAIPVGLTTSSEFGGLNIGLTKLNGQTGNAWDPTRSPGGSSAGSAAAVAGGLVPLATGGDGGGSIRIPAAFNGLVGMKGNAGRIPRGPNTMITPLTVVLGCLSRSVRDIARFYDAVAGYDTRDPYSLPKQVWEANLGKSDLRGLKVAISPTLGSAIVRDELQDRVRESADALVKELGFEVVDVDVKLPGLGFEWAMTNLVTLLAELGDRWPDCKDDLTTEIAFGMTIAEQTVNLQLMATGEKARIAGNEAMATLFDQVDLVIGATNPDAAFPGDIPVNTRVGDQSVPLENNGALTIPANLSGNPAVSIPAGLVDGLPVGMQVIGRHYTDAQLLDIAFAAERILDWPRIAPGAPR